MSLFVYIGCGPKHQENYPPTLLGWIENGFSANSKLPKKKFFHEILHLRGSIIHKNVLRL